MPETILIDEPRPGVARITFNRPDAANALNTQMGEELFEAWSTVGARGGVRCVILAAAAA
jgi:enoyl-CoA hydratase/carnithine racemase